MQQLLAAGTSNEELATYEQADPASMSVAGLSRYWRKYHPDRRLISHDVAEAVFDL